jgi:hypothetical protein
MDTYDPAFISQSSIISLLFGLQKILLYEFNELKTTGSVGTSVAVEEAKQIQDQFSKGEQK